MNPAFRALVDDSLGIPASCISTAEGLKTFLGTRREVLELRQALATGSISTDDIESFVREILGDFRPNEKFPGDYMLAAIAVALESYPIRFAEEFLSGLASARVREIPLATRVAFLALRRRNESVANTTLRIFQEWEHHVPLDLTGIRQPVLRIEAPGDVVNLNYNWAP